MADVNKGRSPFYPGQPVPPEFFVGRADLVGYLMRRGAGQVAAGKPIACFIQGEYGIGKSSLATYAQAAAALEYGLHPIYASVGGAKTVEDVVRLVLEATIRSGAGGGGRSEKVRTWLARYVGEQKLFGLTLKLDKLQDDAPQLATPAAFLGFFADAVAKLEVSGVFLVLDEMNGIASSEEFAHFLKALIETNGVASSPVPLLLVLCGVDERRTELIRNHQSLDRLFSVVQVERMSNTEVSECFSRAFHSVGIQANENALDVFVDFTRGFPKILQIIGDTAYFGYDGKPIDMKRAIDIVFDASEEVGRKLVDQQVLRALRSEDYRSILDRIAVVATSQERFTRKEIASNLDEGERKKLDNCLRKLRDLNVIHSTGNQGEYEFIVEMVRLYLYLQGAGRDRQRRSRV